MCKKDINKYVSEIYVVLDRNLAYTNEIVKRMKNYDCTMCLHNAASSCIAQDTQPHISNEGYKTCSKWYPRDQYVRNISESSLCHF